MKKISIGLLAGLGLLGVAASSSAELMYGLTDSSFNLVKYDSSTPGTFTSTAAMTGVVSGQTLRGIDVNPITGELYALSTINSVSNGAGQLYKVNTTTGALTAVGSQFTLLTGNTRVSMDFNPVSGQINVVTGSSTNAGTFSFTLNPTTGVKSSLTNVASGFNPTGIAFTNNTAGATSTQGYIYDYDADQLGTFNPTTGAVTLLGANGLSTFTNTGSQGFDISGVTGTAYLNLDIGSSLIDDLYTANLTTGILTKTGSVTVQMLDISAASAVPEPGTIAVLGLGAIALLRRRRK